MDIVAVDLGGTHSRFAIARIDQGRVAAVTDMVTLTAAHHADFRSAWNHYAGELGHRLPRAAAIAVACPVNGKVARMTNSPWVISLDDLRDKLSLGAMTLVNDFGAVGLAVGHIDPRYFQPVAGPDHPLPEHGLTSIIGPGTGLGVAQLLRRAGRSFVIETEGGHSDFAPLDAVEDAILSYLRRRYRRVSVERIVSGPGLLNIYEALCAIYDKPATIHDDRSLWAAAVAAGDEMAEAALSRFCQILGSVAGDIALTQGASAVVIAGGIGPRIADKLASSGFADRFIAKGRFESLMTAMPVKLVTHPHTGLIGAAAAFAEEHMT